jgi:hypothetical protein
LGYLFGISPKTSRYNAVTVDHPILRCHDTQAGLEIIMHVKDRYIHQLCEPAMPPSYFEIGACLFRFGGGLQNRPLESE